VRKHTHTVSGKTYWVQ